MYLVTGVFIRLPVRKRQKQNSTGFRGVSQVRPGKFQGRASIPGQQTSMSVISTALRKLRRPCKSQSAICVNNNQLRHELPGARCASHALPSLPTCVTISICCGRPSWRVRHRRLRRRWRWQGGTGRQRARFLIRRSACRTGPFPYDGPHPLILPRVM